jgi:hypothetical protein
MKHYRVHHGCMNRWIEETGIEPKVFVPCYPEPKPRPSRARQAKNLGQMGGGLVIRHDNRVKSMFDHAADTLRAERWVVHRCNERGAYAEKGELWRVGNVVLTPDELLQRADRYRKVAA